MAHPFQFLCSESASATAAHVPARLPDPTAGTRAGTSGQGGRRLRLTPPSHNTEVRKLLGQVVDSFKENIKVVKETKGRRMEQKQEIINQLKIFNDNYEMSLTARDKKKRKRESDSDE